LFNNDCILQGIYAAVLFLSTTSGQDASPLLAATNNIIIATLGRFYSAENHSSRLISIGFDFDFLSHRPSILLIGLTQCPDFDLPSRDSRTQPEPHLMKLITIDRFLCRDLKHS
jgi:hypothetical protein